MTTAMLFTADLPDQTLTYLDPTTLPPIVRADVLAHNDDDTLEVLISGHQVALAESHKPVDVVAHHVPSTAVIEEDNTMTIDPRTLSVTKESTFLALDNEFITPGHESRYSDSTWVVNFPDANMEGMWFLFVKHDEADDTFTGEIAYHRFDDPDATHVLTLPPSHPVPSDGAIPMVEGGLFAIHAGLVPTLSSEDYYRLSGTAEPGGFIS